VADVGDAASDIKTDPLSYTWSIFDHEANPGTRDKLPPLREREQLGLGDFAHITLTNAAMPDGLGENVWVRVLERKHAGKGAPIIYSGELDTSPRLVSGLKAGHAMVFNPRHVRGIESTVKVPGGGGGGGGGGGVLLLLAALAFGKKHKGKR
jgi:hypothetical protein